MPLTTAELIECIVRGKKYRHINRQLLEKVVASELVEGRNESETVKACKNKLHQIAASYFAQPPRYDEWLAQLKEAVDSREPEYLRETCRHIMHAHASTRERLPILEQFYQEIFNIVPRPTSIIDVACGLNPLSLPWIAEEGAVSYTALDVFHDLSDFMTQVFALLQIDGEAVCADITSYSFEREYDLALVLKVLPPLAQQEKEAPFMLLENIRAKNIVVSFPTRSLGGKAKGMGKTYEEYFHTLTEGIQGEVQRLEFQGELVFVVKREGRSLAQVLNGKRVVFAA